MTPAVRTSTRHAAHADYGVFERRHEDLKSERLGREAKMRDVANFVATTDDVDPIIREGGQLPRNRVDATAQIEALRCSSILNGYLFSPFSPFFKSRILGLDKLPREVQRYLAVVDKTMHAYLTGPRAPFRLAMSIALHNATCYGTGPLWTARKGKRLVSVAVPVWNAWIAEDPDLMLTDTMDRKFTLSAWRAAERWPHVAKIVEIAGKQPNQNLIFVQSVYPNRGGISGGRKMEKPFREVIAWVDGKEIVHHDGYDDFPGAAIRFERRANSVYGWSPGMTVASWAKLINAREDNAFQHEEMNANPALLDFSNGTIDESDRRPGARIPVDPSSFAGGFGRTKPFERMFDPVDQTDSHIRVEKLRFQIARAFYTDWMTPGEGKYETATHINDKRDLRMRAMSSVVSGMEYDFNQIGERFYNLMDAMGLFPDPPESLAGMEIVFDFVSPLAMAQQRGEVERLMGWLEVCAQAIAFDPAASRMVVVPEVITEAGRQFGVPEEVIRSFSEFRQEMQRLDDAEERAEDAELTKVGAAALRDAGAGAAALIGAGGPRQVQ